MQGGGRCGLACRIRDTKAGGSLDPHAPSTMDWQAVHCRECNFCRKPNAVYLVSSGRQSRPGRAPWQRHRWRVASLMKSREIPHWLVIAPGASKDGEWISDGARFDRRPYPPPLSQARQTRHFTVAHHFQIGHCAFRCRHTRIAQELSQLTEPPVAIEPLGPDFLAQTHRALHAPIAEKPRHSWFSARA